MQNYEKEQNRRESEKPVNDGLDHDGEISHFVVGHIVQQDDAVEKATEEEETLHQVSAVDN